MLAGIYFLEEIKKKVLKIKNEVTTVKNTLFTLISCLDTDQERISGLKISQQKLQICIIYTMIQKYPKFKYKDKKERKKKTKNIHELWKQF